jgi:hypothetical protein
MWLYDGLMSRAFEELSFGEKIRHKMVHDKRYVLSEFADKADVKSRVSKLIGPEYIVPTISIIEHESELNFAMYPREFVLKPTHGSQAGIIVSEQAERLATKNLPIFGTWERYYEIHPDDFEINQGFATIMTRRWLTSKYRPEEEFCYRAIKPRVIVEQYIKQNSSGKLFDFRFYTFHGEAKFFRTALGYSDDLPTYAYDEHGSLLSVKATHDNVDYNLFPTPGLPKEWKIMKSFAEGLSEGIDFVRVDFYLTDGKIYFSELTNYPQAGSIRFMPESFDQLVSSFWKSFDCCDTEVQQ